ncbi:MAG: hypothetical protein MJZ41_15190 [Bacteroidaceae bacterium]|nr:hypothetical protein [Bacteroidaceae bacterium]
MKKLLTILAATMMCCACNNNNQKTLGNMNTLQITQEWDKTFSLSDKVNHQ